MIVHDLSSGSITLNVTPITGPKGDTGPAGMGASVPGGRLTLVSGRPEMLQTADYSSPTLYYAPFASDKVPLFDGTNWASYAFSSSPVDTVGLAMIGGSKWVANTQRDVFIALVSGEPRLCTSPAWPDNTLPSRGLIRHSGLWVNAGEVICDLSETETLTLPIYQGAWVGSINIGPDGGLLKATFTLGQNRRCDVWNVYHQREVLLGVGCPPTPPLAANTWKPSNNALDWRAFNNDLNNSGYYFTGLPQNIEGRYLQRGFLDAYNSGICAIVVTICKNTVSNSKGTFGSFSSDVANVALGVTVEANFKDKGSVGSHRAIMAASNANESGILGASLWGLTELVGRSQDEAHAMWIKYQG